MSEPEDVSVMSLLYRVTRTHAPAATLLIRVMVGVVFLSEGIQKFLDPAARGVGRFVRIGIPFPEVMGPFVGAVEIVCSVLVLLGLLTRLAALPLLIDMGVAIVATKVPLLLGRAFWGFQLAPHSSYGVWTMAHEARTDFAMLLGAFFLLMVGSGSRALDPTLARRFGPPAAPP